jgi:hypothetical protein
MVVIDENFNVCKIDKYIKNVKGMHTGGSPTDAWIITLKNNVFDKNGDKINKAFIKIFSNLSFFNSEKYDIDFDSLEHAVKGLTYETNIYKNVVTPLVEYGICPNFIRFLGSGTICSYDDLYRMLLNNYSKGSKKVSPNIIQKKLKRGINNNILNYEYTNVSLDDSRKYSTKNNYDINELQFDIILTETYDSKSFHEILKSPDIHERNINNILFQIFAACYTMSLTKMVHNDLHSGNIMVRNLIKPKTLFYIINNKKYVLKVKYFVYIYDFDRAYAKRLGDNENLEMYDVFSQNNELINNKDVLKLLCSVYKYTNNISYLRYLTNDETHLNNLVKLFVNDRRCNFQLQKYVPVKSSFFKNYNSMETIIENISQNLSNIVVESFDEIKNNIYICNSNFFDNNGNIIEEKVFKSRREIISKLKNEIKTSPKKSKVYPISHSRKMRKRSRKRL